MKTVELIKIIVISSLLVLLSNQLLYSQKWTIYTSANGFTNVMETFTQDPNNTYWVGSVSNGIYKFDGNSWTKPIMKTPSEIYEIITDNNDIYAGTNGGLLYIPNFDDSKMQLLKFNDDISQNNFYTIAKDSSGKLWLGEGDINKTMLLNYNGSEWNLIDCKSLGPQSYISAIIVDSQNRKWFTSAAGLTVFNDTTFTTYNYKNSILPNAAFTCLELDKKGNIWIGTFGYGVYKFDGTQFETFTTSNSNLPNGIMVNGIVKDKFDNIWIGTQNTGVFKYNGDNWFSYNVSNSQIPSNFIQSLAVDNQNRKIFSTMDKGLVVFEDDLTSISSNEPKKSLLLSENIVQNFITLSLNESELSNVIIFNYLGVDVSDLCKGITVIHPQSKITIDVSLLPPSMYIVRIGNSYGKFVKL